MVREELKGRGVIVSDNSTLEGSFYDVVPQDLTQILLCVERSCHGEKCQGTGSYDGHVTANWLMLKGNLARGGSSIQTFVDTLVCLLPNSG